MDLELTGKVQIITGAASGIGKRTAEFLADEGCKLVLADFNEEALGKFADELSARDVEVATERTDVRDYAQCDALAASAVRHFGRIDGLVNSAGVGGIPDFFAQSTPDDWRDTVEINLIGVMNCARAVAERMIDQGSGKIVSLASEAGKANEKRMVVYGATKGGVISFTRGLALELGRYGINVNCVCPGVTKTPMTAYIEGEIEEAAARFYPLGRLGTTDDIAPMITFLLSEKTSWVTGQAISISGGFGRS
jgi:NAD(P)-dependent dehydrogenase (short-subunit alcohol dehydrogenase family)